MRKAEKLIIAIKELEHRRDDCKSTPTFNPKIFQGRIEALEYAIKELLKILATCPINEQRNMCG